MNKITVKINGAPVKTPANTLLSVIINGEKPCGGNGKCGKCKVKAIGKLSSLTNAEKEFLSKKEILNNVRLACQTYALGDCDVKTISKNNHTKILSDGKIGNYVLNPTFTNYGIAVDVGTTTIVGTLYNSSAKLLAKTQMVNPQIKWGADVISRIEFALNGNERVLKNSIIDALNNLINKLTKIASVSLNLIDYIVITGNTAMLYFLTGENVKPLSKFPFKAEKLFGETITAKNLGLNVVNGETKVYLPPCISAFVGADTTSAILSTNLCENKTAMLVDIGTNGEMALYANGKLTVCSTAAGPAFEGVGISSGMTASSGAIDKITILNGKIRYSVIDKLTPIGICGSGLIDAVACLIDLGVLEESGYLSKNPYYITENISITQKDIRNLQLSKSAINAGLLTLLKNACVKENAVDNFYIAGGFGNYINVENAVKIGLLPKVIAKQKIVVGNAALSGAIMLLLDKNAKNKAENIAKNATPLNLATDANFINYYTMSMFLSETQL